MTVGAGIALKADRRPLVEAHARSVPPKYRGFYIRGSSGRSRKAAVRAYCLECTGFDRSETDKCTGIRCPLHPYRRVSISPKTAARRAQLQGGRGLDPRIKRTLEKVAKNHKKRYLRAIEGRSRTAAILEFCSQCMGGSDDMVRECLSLDCPLYLYRLSSRRRSRAAGGASGWEELPRSEADGKDVEEVPA